MKSIKEQSNEYAKEYLFSPLPQRAPNVHFEAGANYVLEQFESILPFVVKKGIVYGKIKELIEQLKK